MGNKMSPIPRPREKKGGNGAFRSPYFTAGVITLFIFFSGLLLGVFLDNWRYSTVQNSISTVDVDSNDAILLTLFFQRFGNQSCATALQENLMFNDRIYQDGKTIENYLNQNRFTPELQNEWRKYILLQTQFWFNSMELKKDCGFSYANVLHLYKTDVTDPQEQSVNKVQSQVMLDLKNKCGNKIMLIPLSVDQNISTVDAIVAQYHITRFPAVVINEKTVFQGLTDLNTLNNVTNC